jgi:hypothetical protein
MGQSDWLSAVMVSLVLYSADARLQTLHNIIYRNLSEHVFNCRVDLLQDLTQNGLDIDAHGTIPTRRLTVQRENAPVFQSLVDIKQGHFGRVAGQSGSTHRTSLGNYQAGFRQFTQHPPDYDRIRIYTLSHLLRFERFVAGPGH